MNDWKFNPLFAGILYQCNATVMPDRCSPGASQRVLRQIMQSPGAASQARSETVSEKHADQPYDEGDWTFPIESLKKALECLEALGEIGAR